MRLILRILINAAALWVTALLLPTFNLSNNLVEILLVAVIFGLVNSLIRPIVKLLSLPINILTLGLFTLVINTAMLLLTAWFVGDYLNISGGPLEKIFNAFIASLIISVVSMILGWILPD